MLISLMALLFIGLALGVPVFVSMSFSTIVSMLAFGDYDIVIAVQRLFDGMD